MGTTKPEEVSPEQIAQGLHAGRVVRVPVDRAHGPLELEQLAAAVSQLNPAAGRIGPDVRRPIALDRQTWRKLD